MTLQLVSFQLFRFRLSPHPSAPADIYERSKLKIFNMDYSLGEKKNLRAVGDALQHARKRNALSSSHDLICLN
jgi:hypothetical protein